MKIRHPYADTTDPANWLRGNLHTHTTRSDGARAQQDVVDDYAARGYGFLMISDHDIFTSPEDLARLNARGMILIPGNEITAHGVHLLHVNARGRVEPGKDRQKVIDDALALGGFVIANHPCWFANFDHCCQDDLQSWRGYTGMEIYNGVIGRLEGSQYATNHWDMLLSKGRHVWGFANDDSHAAEGDVGLGWNVAYVTDRSAAGVTEALAAGRFYASTGVTINRIVVEGARITIEAENADRIVATADNQRRFAVVDKSSISVEAPENATYVRFECWGRGEQFAWTQPFFIEK